MKTSLFLFICVLLLSELSGRPVPDNIEAQGQVLASIERLHDPRASAFVDAWQKAHPSPSASDIAKLRVDAERIVGNPNVAPSMASEVANEAEVANRTTGRDRLERAQWMMLALAMAGYLFCLVVLRL